VAVSIAGIIVIFSLYPVEDKPAEPNILPNSRIQSKPETMKTQTANIKDSIAKAPPRANDESVNRGSARNSTKSAVKSKSATTNFRSGGNEVRRDRNTTERTVKKTGADIKKTNPTGGTIIKSDTIQKSAGVNDQKDRNEGAWTIRK